MNTQILRTSVLQKSEKTSGNQISIMEVLLY